MRELLYGITKFNTSSIFC